MAIFVRGLPAARLCSKISGVGLRVYMGSKSKLQGFACLGFRASRLGKVSLLCSFLTASCCSYEWDPEPYILKHRLAASS